MNQSIIGLVGEAGVGKGEISRLLIESGFRHYSLSDSLRRIATDLGLPHDREVLIRLGNSLRERFGGDILARGAKEWINSKEGTNVVIESIRNPSEVLFLQSELGALIIGVTMSLERRFELMKERKRQGDPQSWEEFQNLIRQERGIGEKETGQQVQKCLELANILLPNNGTINDLGCNIKELLLSRGISVERHG